MATANTYLWKNGNSKSKKGSSNILANVEIIAPGDAIELLKTNKQNRKIKENLITHFVREIKAGRWTLTGEPIIISGSGKLLDGQHRLHAVTKSKQPVSFLVVRGVDESAFLSMGQGVKRNLSDVLGIEGYKYESALASITNLLYRWEKTGGNFNDTNHRIYRLSNSMGYQFVKDHPGLEHAAKYAYEKKKGFKLLTPAVLGFLHYLLRKASPDDCNLFFAKLVTGEGLTSDDPVHALREKLISLYTEKKDGKTRVRNPYYIAICIKAWNLIRTNQPSRRLVFGKREQFPQPV